MRRVITTDSASPEAIWSEREEREDPATELERVRGERDLLLRVVAAATGLPLHTAALTYLGRIPS